MGVVLAGLAPVEFYDNNKTLVMTAKVPTDAGLNASVSEDVIRGGNNNQRISSYFFDSNLMLTVTSPTFDKKYLTNKLGSTIESGAKGFYIESVLTTVADTITVVDKTPIAFFEGDTTVYGWYKLATESDEEYKVFTFTGSTGTVTGLPSGTDVCVKYAYLDAAGSNFKINSQIIPNILTAIMKIPELQGDSANGYTNSSKVGEMIVTIPRYQFDPNTEIALTSGGHATISLNGNALVNEGTGCDATGWYATIDEIIYGATEFGDVKAIVIENSDIDLVVPNTETLSVIKLFKDNTGKLPDTVSDYSLLTFLSDTPAVATVSAAGVVTAVGAGEATITITVTATPSLSATAYVNVTV